MSDVRDMELNPYTPDEIRVVEYLKELIPDIGAGDDPIGFLIASHHHLVLWHKASLTPSEGET